MAWYLNEFVTDVHLLPGALYRLENYYLGEKLQPGTRAWRSLYRYLRSSGHNLDLIDGPHPLRGPGNLFNLMTGDLGLLMRNLSLIEPSDTIETMPLGKALGTPDYFMGSVVGSGLLHWQTGKNRVYPARLLNVALSRLHVLQAVPCAGLMLPEFIKVMRLLEQGENSEDCVGEGIEAILAWRREATGGNLPLPDASHEETMAARMQVCDYLAGQDKTIWDDLQRGRVTETIILSSGLAVYGGLFDEVQFITINERLQKRFMDDLTMRPGSWRVLDGLSPTDLARRFNIELRYLRHVRR